MKTLILSLSLAALTACGSATSDTTATSALREANRDVAATVTPGLFKMYPYAHFQPSTQCDVHTRLSLDNGAVGAVAVLKQVALGTCEILVRPDSRAYGLKEVGRSCGSRIYAGTSVKDALDPRQPVSIEIVDHRSRTCRDVVDARVITKETYADGKVVTLYASPVALPLTYRGTLFEMAALGGETTGFGLMLDGGRTVELDLAQFNLTQLFVPGQRVEVQGEMILVHGVEIPERDVLFVSKLTAL